MISISIKDLVRSLGLALWGFAMFTFLLEGLEFANVLPVVISMWVWLAKPVGKALIGGVFTAGALVLMQVFMMRYNVVIGGQEISKTAWGLLSYQVPVMGQEGMLVVVAIIVGTLALLWLLTRIFPPGEDQPAVVQPRFQP